ncbi:laccase-13-like isoform X2 [Rhodamnia argentea]|uniref:Laccase n=1 Tax=Rhodamnia argentea TaxID=178133 RepID=A0ABM3HTG6_9MYRT|nr:laccase-13-like isoform X2 [Rhodamnia argentea]
MHKLIDKPDQSCLLIALSVVLASLVSFSDAEVHYHEFVIQAQPVKRLCRTHKIITVNGQFPGPILEVRDGDSLVIKTTNIAQYNVTLHWHGVRQLANPWADGPEYVTQCPIQPGGTYTYRFNIQKQEGTLWWHAHSKWLRATVYGALIIYPKVGLPYPFLTPNQEIPILLGEWWDRDPMDVLRQALFTGAAPNVSDAYTINGQPGDFYRCSNQETAVFSVESGETVLLRFVNAALNQELFFAVANHKLTVVGVDAAYTKPFTTSVIMIAPGQTTDVLLTADQSPSRYYMAASAYHSSQNAAFDNTTTTAILEYKSESCSARRQSSQVLVPQLPASNDTATATAFTAGLRSPSKISIPNNIDENLFFTVGLGLINCSLPSPNCQGPNGTRFTASMNNVSFVLPTALSVMQAYYQGVSGIFSADFPPVPPIQFDYTGNIVLQDTSILSTEDHPIHLHGYQFSVVGMGFGNFDAARDMPKFNLVDPPVRNTIGTPPGGWVAIRFVANNPGVWLMHCHIDSHLVWGLAMCFLVENGEGEQQTVIPPPPDLPKC